MGDTLKDKATRGLLWGGLNNVVQQGLGLVFGIVMGRLLSRSDYGMTAMIAVFALVATALQESGFRAAIANLQQPRHEDYNSVFWFNVLVGTACYALLFAAAPAIAAYYATPELTLLCRVSFLSIVFSSLGTAQLAYLFRNMRVKEQSQCNMAATIVSNILGVAMAVAGCGYWSLAAMQMSYIGLNTLLLWRVSPWRPTTDIDFGPVRRMFRFSSKVLATSVLERVNANVMNLLLGRFYTTQTVGDYNQAYQWSSKVMYLIQGTLAQVAQPVFTDAAGDSGRQLRILRKLVRFTAFLSFPMLLGLGLVAHEFIVLTIGPKWSHSAALLQLLCISGAFVPLCTVFTNMLISKGRSGTYLLVTMSQCVALVALMVLLHPYGIRSMVVAYVGVYLLWTMLWHQSIRPLTGYTLTAFAQDIVPFALAAAAVMGTTWLLTQNVGWLWLRLLTKVVVAATLYYALMRMLNVRIFRECIDFVHGKLRRK
jgi:O-antigen/teichoic acid export membrane protein